MLVCARWTLNPCFHHICLLINTSKHYSPSKINKQGKKNHITRRTVLCHRSMASSTLLYHRLTLLFFSAVHWIINSTRSIFFCSGFDSKIAKKLWITWLLGRKAFAVLCSFLFFHFENWYLTLELLVKYTLTYVIVLYAACTIPSQLEDCMGWEFIIKN